jgi:hypothetical protein
LTDEGKREAPEDSGSQEDDKQVRECIHGGHNGTHEQSKNEPEIAWVMPVTMFRDMIGCQANPSIDGEKNSYLKGD